MKRIVIDVTTDSGGAATVYSSHTKGKVHSITYLKDGTTPFDNGVDFTITVEDTAESIWTQADQNATATKYPRAAVHDGVGAARLYASGGTGVSDKIGLATDRIKVVIAQGGNAKKGQFLVLLDD